MRGRIVKGIAGFYYVDTGDKIWECKARGLFRKDGITPLVGDLVEIVPSEDGSATVDEILPRENEFLRPPVANVEIMVLVAAAKDPDPNFFLLDRFCIMAEKMGCELAICVTKTDIAGEDIINRFKKVYGDVYPLFFVNGLSGEGSHELRQYLQGKTVALAGPSGVGKSSLTNILHEKEIAQTGEISRKTLRGKNTTRHTELFSCDGFSLFDTPGFTSFELTELEEGDADKYFPEFAPYLGKCRFDNCRHMAEPGCAVNEAASQGQISKRRYASYKDIIKNIRLQEKNKY